MPTGVYKRKKECPLCTRLFNPKGLATHMKHCTGTANQNQAVISADMVNHPPHYTFGKFEVIDVLEDWFKFQPLLWQAAKYMARAEHKGNKLQDLKKAKFYLDRAVKELES